MTEKDAVTAFSTFVPIGPARFGLLVQYFGSAKKAWGASIGEYLKIGFNPKLAAKFESHRRAFDIDFYKEKLKSLGVRVVTLEDEEYPARLKEIQDPPFLLYVRGSKETNLAFLADVSIAVIGTRKMTSYGKDVTERFGAALAQSGVTIVSGLALGIDAISHEAALFVDGATIAVLGNGLDQVYPPRNTNLARDIVNSGKGLLVSEYPLGYPAMPQNFPQRNRIVSGLSRGVLVIEGTKRSGTLLTAAAAARQGRDVYAVPGPVTSPVSQAPHLLIREGAKLVERAEDILEDLDINAKLQMLNAKRELPGTKEEARILETLANEGLDIDRLVRIVGLPTGEVLGTLTTLELKGIVKNVGGVYQRVE